MTEPKHFPNQPTPVPDAITEWLESNQWPSKRKQPGTYKASDALKCMRKVYYQRRPDEYPVDDDLPLGLFEQGNNTERSFVRAMRHAYGAGQVVGEVAENDGQPWVRVEIDAGDDTILVRGYPDCIVLRYNQEPWVLYEVKSKSKTWDGMTASKYHAGQLVVYWKALEPEHARLVYVSRNDVEDNKEFEFAAMEAAWSDVKAWFRRLYLFELEDQVPPAVPSSDFDCSFCPYSSTGKVKGEDICPQDGGWGGDEKPWHRAETPKWLKDASTPEEPNND